MIISSYDVHERSLLLIWIVVAGFTLLSVPLAISLVYGLPGAQGVAFLMGILAIWAWNCHRFLFRVVYRLELTPQELRWRTALRMGRVPLSEPTCVRRSGSRQAKIEFASRRPVRIVARDGLHEFAADLKKAAPQVDLIGIPGGYKRYQIDGSN